MDIVGDRMAEKVENPSLPHAERPIKGTTFIRTCFNGLNALSGVGILSIPFALSQGGWLSLCLLVVISVLCCYTGLLLQLCMGSHPSVKTYPDIGELAFGRAGRALVCFFMYLELYLVAVEFLILEGDNLEKLFPQTVFNIHGLRINGKQGFVLLSALVIWPTTWLRSMGALAYVSASGCLASVILVFCVLWVGAGDGVGFHEKGTLVDWAGLPTSISLYTFCYCGHAVFPTLCNSMKDRSRFSRVLLVCFITSTINYGTMAVLGYLMYGDGIKSQVTLNLPTGKLASKLAIYTTLINPFAKYAVMINPIATAIESAGPFGESRWVGIVIRTVVLIGTVIVALCMPFFGEVMAFTGAFLSVTVSIVLPCVCYLRISKGRSRKCGAERMVIIGIVVVGVFVGVVGTFSSLRQIIRRL
ncbi:hypothetical protein MLD38_007434 [Melastoma candidum]|uniref:Uncharacterized protein n=1 Tax=Melastoma candidum TaxID=119954 RepID=A0ACB9RR31_9MYRT|nr:hypothetical protein MLD38_007434 [Melastoma candidum]